MNDRINMRMGSDHATVEVGVALTEEGFAAILDALDTARGTLLEIWQRRTGRPHPASVVAKPITPACDDPPPQPPAVRRGRR